MKMKTGAMICYGLFTIWVLLLIAEAWFGLFDSELMFKLSLTLAGAFIIVLAAILVFGSYQEEKRWRDEDHIG